MVGVREGAPCDVPRLVPPQPCLVEQDAHQLGNGHRRMGVVELDGGLLGEIAPIRIAAAKAPHQVGERAGDQEILLQEAQSLSPAGGVVGVQDPRQGLGGQGLGQRADEVAAAESLEVEIVGSGRRPQTKRVDRLAAVADHRPVERNAEQDRGPPGDGLQLARAQLERSVELHFDGFLQPRHFPGVLPAQPVVRLLDLPAVLDRLPEDAVLVAQAVTHRRQGKGRHGVKKARGQAPEPAVAEAGIGLRLDQRRIDVALPFDELERHLGQLRVDRVVHQRAAEQEFHRKVVHALRVLLLVRPLGQQPALGDHVAQRARHRFELLARRRLERIDHIVEQQVTVVERLIGARELHWPAPVLLAQRVKTIVHDFLRSGGHGGRSAG